MSMTVRLDGLKKMVSDGEHKKRQTELAMRAAQGMRKYVPVEEGTLRSSEPLNSQYEKGILIWNTPYARKHYMVPMKHTDANATDHWDEAYMKREGDDLVKYAATLYEGY